MGTLPETPMYRGDEVDFRVRLPVGHLDGDGLVGAIRRPGDVGPGKYLPCLQGDSAGLGPGLG